jgi:hypothetical protein
LRRRAPVLLIARPSFLLNHFSLKEPDLDEIFALSGPVELVDGKLTLRIPLEAGGDQLIECSRGISEIEGEYLKIVIPEWLAGTLRIEAGDIVSVDNENAKFNIRPVNPRPIH